MVQVFVGIDPKAALDAGRLDGQSVYGQRGDGDLRAFDHGSGRTDGAGHIAGGTGVAALALPANHLADGLFVRVQAKQ